MEAYELQKKLAEEIEIVTKDIYLKDSSNKKASLKAFTQYLPKQLRTEKEDPYPYCIVRLMNGSKDDSLENELIRLFLIIGIRDDDKERTGYVSIMNIIERIDERFSKNGILADKFVLNGNVEWTMQEEDTHPYYCAGMELSWKTNTMRKEDKFT